MAMTSEHRGIASRHLRTVFNAGALGALTDSQLLERYRAGRGDDDSAAAFAALVERHGPMVLGVCHDVLDNLHDAEDAAQATFLILAKRAGSIRRAGSVASWLFGVALKVAVKARAQAARRRAIEQRGAEMKVRDAGSKMAPETRSELHAELDRLPERLRAPIVLCHLEGLSNEQAAGQLGLPVRTVQRRLSQGREHLRDRLVRRGVVPAAGAGTLAIDSVAEAASSAWIEATVAAAAGLAAGKSVATVARAPVAALVNGTTAMMLVARLMAVAAGVVFAGTLVALAGALFAARPQAQPVESKSSGARSAPPPVAKTGPWIRGIVVDEQGRRVAGASVSPMWNVAPKPVITKADGTFELPTPERRRVIQSLLATADGGARQGTFRFDRLSGFEGPRTVPRIVLRPAVEVTVTVVDGRGAPVADAAVFILDVAFPVGQAHTDARGIAVLRVAADARTWWIVGCKSGVGFDYFENYRSVPPTTFSAPPRAARLVLDGARTVRVHAVDAAGRPVEGVEFYPVTFQIRGKLRSVNLAPLPIDPRTDANGVATFDWLPMNLQREISFLSASLSDYLPDPTWFDPNRPDHVEPTARVLRRPARVSGKVTRPDGSPAPGILVEASGVVGKTRQQGGSGRAWTAADGSYAMDLLPEQSYLIRVINDEWTAKGLSCVIVREGVAQTGLDLTLERGSLVWGKVTVGPESRPAPGRGVMLTEQGPDLPPGQFKDQARPLNDTFMRVADTDEDGRYAFRVGPGNYGLTGPRVPGDRSEPIELKIVAGQDVERDFHLARDDRPWRTVRGTVRAKDAAGAPIPGAVMVVQPIEDRGPEAQGYADDRGRFAMPRFTGKVIVYARSPAGDLAGYAVIEGDDDQDVALIARPAATARGRIVDEDGKPWASLDVHAVVEVGLPAVGRDQAPGAGQMVLTDDDGRFTALGLPVGTTCRFWSYAPGTNHEASHRTMVKDARPFEVPPLIIRRPEK